jgi:polyhydroxyalkanoate synthase
VGETSIFISEEYVADIERRMESKGYLDALEMASVFNLMRSNDLIWSFVVNNYLLGKEPMPFDLMYWSVDGTRMPRAMHSYYLRNMYLENNLIKPGHLTMLDQSIDLGKVRESCYVVAGLGDHIVPWRSAHRIRALFAGKTRPVLGYGGHITSIINPPARKRGFYYTSDSETTNPDEWLKNATQNQGSWWPDWVKWLRRRSGKKVPAPAVGNDRYPALLAAPGSYVLED